MKQSLEGPSDCPPGMNESFLMNLAIIVFDNPLHKMNTEYTLTLCDGVQFCIHKLLAMTKHREVSYLWPCAQLPCHNTGGDSRNELVQILLQKERLIFKQ